MSEGDTIAGSDAPVLRGDLVEALRGMGLGQGDVVLAHVRLSYLGWVLGGAPTVVGAILDVIGPQGTLCMPGNTAHLSDPADWQNPPVPEAWHDVIRREMPLFDAEVTPPRGIGACATVLWRWPGTRRSEHPQVSMLANGAQAEAITGHHPRDNAMGPEAPLGRIAGLGGKCLMLGTDYGACTTLHLAEYRVPRPVETVPLPVARTNGVTQWYGAREPETLHPRFPEVGAAFETAHPDKVAWGMDRRARLIGMAALVSFAANYFAERSAT